LEDIPKMKDKHHRRPKWWRGSNAKWNIATVDERKHAAFHYLFQVDGHPMTVEEIVDDLNNLWLDPTYKLTIERR
jgi:chloramphenicol 3-O-phosphotransferase